MAPTEVLPPATDVEVIAAPSPFSTKRVRLMVGERATLEEIVHQAGVPAGCHARVFIESPGGLIYGPIPRSQWRQIRPKKGRRVTIRAVPSGGGKGDSNKTLRLVLMIVILIIVIVIAYFVPPAWAAVPLIIGSLAIAAVNMLLAPPPPKLGTLAALAGETAKVSQTYTITGSQNKANPYGVVAKIYGRHQVFPVFGGVPFTETLGDKQFLRQLFVVGYGPLALSDLKIGTTPLDNFIGVEYEVRQGFPDDPPLTLYTQDVGELALSVVLTAAGGPQARVATQPATELSVDVVFPQGLAQFSSEAAGSWPLTVTIRVEYRQVGAVDWTVVPDANPLTITDNQTSQVRAGIRWQTPAEASYEVRLTRLTADATSAYTRDQSVWSALRAFRPSPPITLSGLCQVAMRIQATDQLNGVVDQFNCLATSILPDWDMATQTWVTRATRNPAAVYRDVLQGPANARPVPDSRLDLPSLQDWAEACTAGGFTFNQVVDTATTVYQQLQVVAAAARGAFTLIDGRYGILQDKLQTTPVQHFTPRNTWGFKGVRLFADPIHALKVQYINPDANWQLDERLVYDDGYDATTATKFEVMQALGVTDAEQAWRLGRYHLAAVRLRPETFEIQCDIENLICTRGDLVRLTHDVMLVGLCGGRVRAVLMTDASTMTGLTLDEDAPMVEGAAYVARVRTQDGGSLLLPVLTQAGLQRTLQFATPLVGGTQPAVGDLVLFGTAGRESLECIVKAITHEKDFLATLTLLPYSPAIYTADQGPVPPYDSLITQQAPLHRTPPVPVIDAVQSDETVLLRGGDGTLVPQILLTLHYQANSQIQADWLEMQYRRSDATGAYLALPNAPPGAPRVTVAPVEQGVTYDLRLRSVARSGATSVWVMVAGHTVVGKSSPPPDPSGLILIGQTLSWAYGNPPVDLAGFVIRRVAGATARWEEGLLLHGGLVTATTSFTLPPMSGVWTLMVKAVDTSGNASSGMATLTQDFGDPLRHNVVETRDEHAAGFPGTKEACTVSGITGDLEADQVPAGFWASNSTALVWTDPAGLFWTSPYEQLRYTWTYVTGTQAAGTTLLIEPGTQGVTSVEYKVSASPDWLPFPGAVSNIQALTSYDLRVTIAAGAVQGIIDTLVLYLDAPDLTEHFDDLAIAGGGTRLTLVNTYRTIKSVSATVQAFGAETAITARVQDKSATLGPLVETLDGAGASVPGHADVSLVGF